MSSLDFGVQIEPQYGFTYTQIKEVAQAAERLGYESIWVSDHFFMTPDTVDTNCLECYTVLTALARDTRRLRLGAMVASQSYRNPALLAKMAASLDHISGGRLYFGVGAGWKEAEYRAYGYPFPGPGVRIRQLDEAIEVCRRMWTNDRASFEGKYYTVRDALSAPKPVQRPLPVWVGGTGTQTLRVAAKHADAVNFAWSQPPAFFGERLKVLERHCKKIGRDPAEIRKSAGLMVVMDETSEGVEARLEALRRRRDAEYMRYLSRQPPNVTVTPDALAELLGEYAALGVGHFILRWHYGDELRSLKLFADKVMRKL
ncbi:MAG: LLM class F420-dependent oxidoreductase [Candidatus Bathyarchaeota archaeon]